MFSDFSNFPLFGSFAQRTFWSAPMSLGRAKDHFYHYALYHCTMKLSMQSETSKVLKSKGLVFAQFWSKFDNFNSEWQKTAKMWHLSRKNLLRVTEKLKILHTTNLTRAQKKPQTNFFSPGPSTWWKWDLKYTNILCYFFTM